MASFHPIFKCSKTGILEYVLWKLNPVPYDILSFSQLSGGGGEGDFWPALQKAQLG